MVESTPAEDSTQPAEAASVVAGSPGHEFTSANGALQGDVSDEDDMDDSGYSEGGAGCDESACSLDFGDM